MLEGIYIAYQNQLTYVDDDSQCLATKTKKTGKVGIAIGGGNRRLPLFLGCVSDGILDDCSVGNVFQSPSVEQMHAITKEIDSGAEVLCIYGDYNGDIFNPDMVVEMAGSEDGIRVETVLGTDGIASIGSPPQDGKTTRWGVTGISSVYKYAGAAASKVMSLNTVTRTTGKASWNTRMLGVALTSCVVPCVKHTGFYIEENEIEIGMGIHGGTGIRREKIETADQIIKETISKVIEDLSYAPGGHAAVSINGSGATSLDEQYIVTRKINQLLMGKGIAVHHYYVGGYVTSLEMAGVFISLLELNEEPTKLADYPTNTPFFKQL